MPVTYVNEAGLYRLIFQAHTEVAEHFKNWVFNDVLPTIRKKVSTKRLTRESVINPQRIWPAHEYGSIYTSALLYQFAVPYLVVQMGELQDSDIKRINSWKLGFQKGYVDIMLILPNKITRD